MRFFSGPYRLPAAIGLLLLTAFIAVALGSYLRASEGLQQQVAQALPLAADAIEAELRAELARPAASAAASADDPALRAWLVGGAQDEQQMLRYLAGLRQAHSLATASLVTEQGRRYYNADGTVRQAGAAEEHWLQQAKETPLAVTAEIDAAGALRLHLRHRLQDANGALLGVLGMTIRGDALAARWKQALAGSGMRLYLIDRNGSPLPVGAAPAAVSPVLRELANAARQSGGKPVQREYESENGPVWTEARFLPALGWSLAVEREGAPLLRPLQQALAAGLAVGAIATLLALAILMLSVHRYRLQLMRMAGTDHLTGLLNRQAFEIVFRQSVTEAERNGRPLSAILFDVDFLRRINDAHGDQAGDNVLRKIAQLARDAVRDADILARWGGEEFVILLKECPLEQAAVIAENLREAVDRYDFSVIVPDRHVTVSLGVAQCGLQEQASLFFLRADGAMTKAKVNGRNRLQVAPVVSEESAGVGYAA